ncbi:MAG: hypothetical protein ACLTLQ_05715 [[Clostridium] scindens]
MEKFGEVTSPPFPPGRMYGKAGGLRLGFVPALSIPACGREAEYGLTPAMASKEILIVGGGVAGMEAARVSAMRGHRVTALCEEGLSSLGGNSTPGGALRIQRRLTMP